MPITPDTKDWTWVLERPCPECGFDADSLTPQDVAQRIGETLPRWDAALRRSDVGERPDDSTWSALEYGCHVRDVFALFRERLGLMLAEDGARFADWDQDATAVEKDYASAAPETVRAELAAPVRVAVAAAESEARDDHAQRRVLRVVDPDHAARDAEPCERRSALPRHLEP